MTRRLTLRRPSLAETLRKNQAALDLLASCSDRPRIDLQAPAVRPARQTVQSPKRRAPQHTASEGQVSSAVIGYLQMQPCIKRLERHNRGSATDAKGQVVVFNRIIKGAGTIVDLTGLFVDGRALAIELKHEGWRMPGPDAMGDEAKRARAQAAYIADTVACGGLGGFVTCVEDAQRIIAEWVARA